MPYNKEDNSKKQRDESHRLSLLCIHIAIEIYCFFEQSELTFITVIIIILLLFSMYIVTINILCQFIFLSLFTPETLKEDQETGGPGQLSLKSL